MCRISLPTEAGSCGDLNHWHTSMCAQRWTRCFPSRHVCSSFSKPIRSLGVVWDCSLGDVSRTCLLITVTHTHTHTVWCVTLICVNSLRIHQSSQSDVALSSPGTAGHVPHVQRLGWRVKSLSGRFQPKTPYTHLLSTPPPPPPSRSIL